MLIFKEKMVTNDALIKVINLVHSVKPGGSVEGLSIADTKLLKGILHSMSGSVPGSKVLFDYPEIVDWLKRNHVKLGVKGGKFYIRE